MAQKTFADDFYNEVLKAADDDRNIDNFVVHTKSGHEIGLDLRLMRDPRLSTVGILDNFITMSEVTIREPKQASNVNHYADHVLIPHSSVDYIEIDYKKNE